MMYRQYSYIISVCAAQLYFNVLICIIKPSVCDTRYSVLIYVEL